FLGIPIRVEVPYRHGPPLYSDSGLWGEQLLSSPPTELPRPAGVPRAAPWFGEHRAARAVRGPRDPLPSYAVLPANGSGRPGLPAITRKANDWGVGWVQP